MIGIAPVDVRSRRAAPLSFRHRIFGSRLAAPRKMGLDREVERASYEIRTTSQAFFALKMRFRSVLYISPTVLADFLALAQCSQTDRSSLTKAVVLPGSSQLRKRPVSPRHAEPEHTTREPGEIAPPIA